MSEGVRPSSPSLFRFFAKLDKPNVAELGHEWRKKYLDPRLQKYKKRRPPKGFGILYAIVKRVGKEKVYIGKSKYAAIRRLRSHIRGKTKFRSCIHDALKKYGRGAFRFFILALVPLQQINNSEKSAIKEFNTQLCSGDGYNITSGGDGGAPPPEVVARIKETMNQPDFRKMLSDTKKKQWNDPVYRDKTMKASKKAKNTPESKKQVSEKFKKLWSDPEYHRKVVEGVAETKRAQKLVTDAEIRKIALPYEPVKKNRVKGQYYDRQDGWIGRCDGFSVYKVCKIDPDHTEVMPPSSSERCKEAQQRRRAPLYEEARRVALPYEPVKKKRVKGQYYHRQDGWIGRWDGFKLVKVCEAAKEGGEGSSQ